jgi:hypothetical protein
MIEVEVEIAGKPLGGLPFEGRKTFQFRHLPRIREYIIFAENYYEVEKIFYTEGDIPPRLLVRYAGYV